MILAESFFIHGKPVGTIREDVYKGIVTFEPKHGLSSLAGRRWRSVAACEKAVINSYQRKSK